MSEEHGYQFKLTVNPVQKSIALDAANIIETLAAVETSINAYIKQLEIKLERSTVYKASYLRSIELEIAKQQGYLDAIGSVSHLCGYDYYFFNGKPQDDAFEECSSEYEHQPKAFTSFALE